MTVPDWMLERLLLDDLPAEERARALRELEAEEGGLERLEALRRSNASILARYPVRTMGARIRGELEVSRRPQPLVRWAPVLLAAVALLVAVPSLLSGGPPHDTAYVGVKGTPRLHAVLQTERGAARVDDGATVHAGDVVQLAYVAMGARHGVILSIDGSGVTTLHFPKDHRSTQLAVEGTTPLETAYRLDDAPAFERFLLVTSDTPLDVDAVLAAGRALAERTDAAQAPLEVPHEQTSLLLEKTP